MDGDLISRKAMLEAIDERERIARKYVPDIQDDELRPTMQSIREFVNNRPAVDAEPVRRAQWISVEDELPKKEGKYIVCTERGSVYCTRFYKGGGCEGIFKTDINTHIAYWMPLPKPPKEGE